MIDNNETGLPSDSRTDANSSFLGNYNASTRRHKGFNIFFGIISLLLSIFFVYQTRESTELLGRKYARSQLAWQVNESRRLRQEAVVKRLPENSPVPVPTIRLHDVLYDQYPKQRQLITDTINTLLKDRNFNNNFLKYPICDGLPLEQTGAIIVPFSTLKHPGDRKQMGITEAAYWCLEKAIKKDPDGLTIREIPKDAVCMKTLSLANRPYLAATDGTPRMTTDGTPRIAINTNVVSEYKLDKLKLTLVHELLHAHEAPAYNPFLNLAHDDLTYLSEYNELIYNLNLDGDKRLLNYFLWIASIFALVMTAIQVYFALGGDSRRLWAWVEWLNNTVDKRVAQRKSKKRKP